MSTPPSLKPLADWQVRLATAADAERIYRLGIAVAALPLLARYHINSQSFAEELRTLSVAGGGVEKQQALLVAEADGAPELGGLARFLVGGGGMGQFGRGGYLKLIALHPDYLSRGIGQLLLDAVERLVGEHSKDLFLLTSDFNHGAQRFYARAGYVRVGELPDFVCVGITEIIYWKRLRRSL